MTRPTRRAPAPLSLVPRLRTVWPEPERWAALRLAAEDAAWDARIARDPDVLKRMVAQTIAYIDRGCTRPPTCFAYALAVNAAHTCNPPTP